MQDVNSELAVTFQLPVNGALQVSMNINAMYGLTKRLKYKQRAKLGII